MADRFLPGVPSGDIERIFNATAGKEIESGKLDSEESSAVLAANTFGYFYKRAAQMPPLPDCENESWPAVTVSLERTIRFPWRGGRHPVLDGLVTTPSALIGIESKRFEPYRSKSIRNLSEAYWRPVWGERMKGFENVRDGLRSDPNRYKQLGVAQLFKHAFALRTAVNRQGEYLDLTPILFYIYAEPELWPKSGKPVDSEAKSRHREEIEQFRATVAGDEVIFVSCSYQRLLSMWSSHPDTSIRAHAKAVEARFAP